MSYTSNGKRTLTGPGDTHARIPGNSIRIYRQFGTVAGVPQQGGPDGRNHLRSAYTPHIANAS
jgi:hypothetical protein